MGGDHESDQFTLIEHLIELRGRLLKSAAAVLVAAIALAPFARTLYSALAEPLLQALPQGSSMIATGVAAPFLAPFKFALVLAVFVAMPVVIYQVWAFVAPGLYRREQALARPILFSSVFLFYAGAAFAYFAVFPLVFGFLTAAAPPGVTVMTDISSYLDFVLAMFFAFGLAFEVPVVTLVLIIGGFTTRARLRRMRPYLIVGAFVIGMLLTPPDVISQVMLAVPMWLLFELGLGLSVLLERRRASDVPGATDRGR